MSKTRTFVAVAASSDVRECAQKAIGRLSRFADNVKWVVPENLHWTLQFLGDVDDIGLAEVCRQVGKVAERLEPFVLEAKGLGAFPSIDRPRALWLGADQGAEALCALQDAIEESLAEIGFRGERRRYVPHLTLGRVGSGSHGGAELAKQVGLLEDFEAGSMLVDQVTVYGSELERGGPTYHVLSRAALLGGG